MSMTHRRGSFTPLPSVTVTRDHLQGLDSLIHESLDDVFIDITIRCEGIEQSYSGLPELIEDESIPRIIQTYEMVINARGGTAKISANSAQSDRHRLYIEGYQEWKKYVRRLLLEFHKHDKNPIRTSFKGRFRMAPISLTSSIIAGHFFITISPLDLFTPASQTLPRLYFIYFTSAVVFLSSSFRHILFPYAYWDLRGGRVNDKYVKSFLEVVGLVLLTLLLLPLLGRMFN